MRCLERNKQTFYYCLFGVSEQKDIYGNTVKSFGEAVEMKANISPATGAVQVEQFGTAVEYDKVIVTDDVNCPIDENTVLFIDKEPEFTQSGRPIHDYVVKRVARSLNSVSYAVSKVNVS